MYKIFHNDRLLALSDNWNDCLVEPNSIAYKVTKKTDIIEWASYFLENTQLRMLFLVADDASILLDTIKPLFVCLDAAGGLVRNAAGEVLMIYRNGRWDLPKGRCEANESMEETALREVEEECGIGGLHLHHPITTTYHIYREKEKMYLKSTYWYAMAYSGTAAPVPQTVEGIERVEWVSLSKLSVILPAVYHSIYEVFCEAGFNAL